MPLNTDYENQKTYEQLHTCALNSLSLAADDEDEDFTQDYRDYMMSRAQVYATLALAAATRANKTVTVREDRP